MKRLVWLTLLAVFALTLATWADESKTLVGKIIDIDGKVLMTNRMTEGRWFQGYMQMPTFLDERLKADSGTSATIQFYIGGRAVISPGTEVEIVTTESLQTLKVKSGTLWAQFDEQDKEFQIETAGGVMGIEGTEFFVETDGEGQTNLTVVEGQVRVQSGGDVQVVTDGEEADFRRGVRRFRKFTNRSGMTRKERRQAAFKKLGLDNKPFARYVMTRGLSKRKKRQLLRRLFFTKAAKRRPPGKKKLRKPVRKPRRAKSRFKVRAVDQTTGNLTASWSAVPTRSYALLISTDTEGEDAVWHGKTNSTSFNYPNYGPELVAGQDYYLSVTPLRPDEEPFQNKQGEPVSTQTKFKAVGHQPTYAKISAVNVEAAENPPAFDWPADESAGGYLVKILDGSDTVWLDECDSNDYRYPLSARALDQGTYMVVVESFDKSGIKMAESDPLTFQTDGWEAEGLEGPTRE
jgi:hypothetical protein